MEQEEGRQRTIMIVGIVVFVLLLAITIYFLFFRGGPDDPEGESPTFGTGSGDRGSEFINREDDRKNNSGVFSPAARLRLISEEPVAGATTIQNEEVETVRFLERKNAHVFDASLDSLEKQRISGTTIPRIYEALWANQGEGVVLRYLDENNQTIKTYFANLAEKEEADEEEPRFDLSGSFLRDNILQMALSPNKDKIFWITKTLHDSQGIISNPDGSEAQAVFGSDFTEWIPQWFSENRINMTTKASGLAQGFSYNMPTSSGSLHRVVGEVTGLTTLSNSDGTYVLYSQGENRGIRSFILNTETGESERIFVGLLPEKCAWSSLTVLHCGVPNRISQNIYPDIWYQGKILFTDSIFEIDAENGSSRSIYSPVEMDNEQIDIYKPFISESGKYLIFNDKANMSLWAFTLEDDDDISSNDSDI